jgi:uncharacterized protein YoxC
MQTEALLKQSQQLATELQSQQKELQQTNDQLAQKAQQLAEQNVEQSHAAGTVPNAERGLTDEACNLVSLHRAQNISSPFGKNMGGIEEPLVTKGA